MGKRPPNPAVTEAVPQYQEPIKGAVAGVNLAQNFHDGLAVFKSEQAADVPAAHPHKIARRIPVVLARGKAEIGVTRAFVEYKGIRVILANNISGFPSNHWVLTGYRDKEKGNR